jgi:hypothetical protein
VVEYPKTIGFSKRNLAIYNKNGVWSDECIIEHLDSTSSASFTKEEQGFEPWEDFHPRRFSRPNSGAS